MLRTSGLFFVLATGLAACSSQFDSLPGPGYDMQVRVQGAQLQTGALFPVQPSPQTPNGQPLDPMQPRVTEILYSQVKVARGEHGVEIKGRLSPGATALRIAAAGDPNHWLVLGKSFDFVVPDELQWSANLSFAPTLQTDELLIVNLQAVNKQGEPGPIRELEFFVKPEPAPAPLVVALFWDQAVDFDLYVQLPTGQLVGPSSKVLATQDNQLIAKFAFDSNQQCRIDGRNYEDVVWEQAAAPGRYRVFVDLFSPCQAPAANYWAHVYLHGQPWLSQAGTQYAIDASWPPQEGEAPGELVLEFDLP